MLVQNLVYYILLVQVLVDLFLIIQGFNLYLIEETMITPTASLLLENGFGGSFVFKKQGNYTKFIVGTPRSFSESEVPNQAFGGVISCDFSLKAIQENRLICSNHSFSHNSNQSTHDLTFVQIINGLSNGTIISCSPNTIEKCSDSVLLPGFCYKSLDGQNWKSIVRKPGCPHNQLDLMFVLDGSSSVGPIGFRYIKNWTSLLAEQLFDADIKVKTNLGVIRYSSYYGFFA